jgi:hypothetical protein
MISALTFFSTLKWIDGSPLKIEPYRQDIFRRALDTYGPNGVPMYNMVLAGRGKKNNKSLDLVLAALFVLVCRNSPQGSDALIVANDEDQAGQDLDLARKLVAANPDLADELIVTKEEIRRRDGGGTMRVLPANNVVGQHGKTAAFLGFDEIHGYPNHNLFEALAPDPTRYCLTWVTSYDSLFDEEGAPLHDFKKIGREGTDPSMLYSWYSGDYCTDPAFADLEPELRANPSMSSWPDGRDYLTRQRRRLPSSKFRRLHLNLPGAPQGAFFDQGVVENAIVPKLEQIPPQHGVDYLAFVDMSGGSNDDATLGIAHWDGQKAILDLLINQDTPTPFNPRLAVKTFADACKRYRCREVHGDAYAGQTFRMDFSDLGVDYVVEKQSRTDLYENLEVALNAGQVQLLDLAKLRSEMMTVIRRGASLDHMPGRHDDWATSAAGALTLVNPVLGQETPAFLTFMARQVDAKEANEVPPTVAQAHADHPLMQIGTRRSPDEVRLVVPDGSSHVYGIGGVAYLVTTEGDLSVTYVSLDDAKAFLSPRNLAYREANKDLAERIAGKSAQPPRGVRAIDIINALESSRQRSPFDRGGIAMDALRATGRWPQ